MIKYLKQGGIFFLEKPVTDDEVKIASLINDYFYFLARHDLVMFSQCFIEGALIHSFASGGKVVTKREYIKVMRHSIKKIKPIALENILIRIRSRDEANLSANFIFFVDQKIIGPQQIFLLFKREECGWKISEYEYLN